MAIPPDPSQATSLPPAAGAPPPGADPAVGAPPDDAGDEEDLDTGAEDTVVATIMRSADGTYKLIPGDEPEDGEGGGGEGMVFNSIGELLKGVLETVKTYEATSSGEGTDEDNFQAGYSGGAGGATGAAPGKPMAGGGM